jgi:hypothetical protein
VSVEAGLAKDSSAAADARLVQDGARDSQKPTDVADAPAAPGVFVAVGYGARRLRSTDGMTWTNDVSSEANGGDDPYLLRGVAYGGHQFVAVGWRVMTSPDGITWVDHGVMGQWLGALAWGNDMWVAVGGYGLRATSTDGVTYVDATDTGTAAYRSIAFGALGGGTWMAMGDGGRLSTTTNGTTYTELSALALSGATWGDGVFIGVVGANLESSSDGGVSWTVASTAPASLDSVTYADGQFVAVGSGNALTSPDGVHWSTHSEPQLGGSITYGNGVYATCGGSCSNCCWYSPDGATWSPASVPSGDANALQSVTFGGG